MNCKTYSMVPRPPRLLVLDLFVDGGELSAQYIMRQLHIHFKAPVLDVEVRATSDSFGEEYTVTLGKSGGSPDRTRLRFKPGDLLIKDEQDHVRVVTPEALNAKWEREQIDLGGCP